MTINSSPSRISSFNCPPNSKALVEYWVLELSIFLCATLVVFHIPVYLRPGSLGCGKVALSRWLLYAGEHDAGAPRPAAAGLRDMGKPGLHLSSPMNRKWQGFRGIRARNCFFSVLLPESGCWEQAQGCKSPFLVGQNASSLSHSRLMKKRGSPSWITTAMVQYLPLVVLKGHNLL